MEITLVRAGRAKKINFRGGTIAEVVASNGLNGETFVTKLNGEVAHPRERLREGDILEFVDVIYGG